MNLKQIKSVVDCNVGKLIRATFVAEEESTLLEVDQWNCDRNEVVAFWVDPLTLERHSPPAWNGASPPFGIPHADFESIECVTIDREQAVSDLVAALRSWNWFASVSEPIDFGDYNRLQDWDDWTKVESFPAKIMEMRTLEEPLFKSQDLTKTFGESWWEVLPTPILPEITDWKTEQAVKTHYELVCRLVVTCVRQGVPINPVVRRDWEWLRHGHWPCGRFDHIY